jgi:hypothetical protein
VSRRFRCLICTNKVSIDEADQRDVAMSVCLRQPNSMLPIRANRPRSGALFRVAEPHRYSSTLPPQQEPREGPASTWRCCRLRSPGQWSADGRDAPVHVHVQVHTCSANELPERFFCRLGSVNGTFKPALLLVFLIFLVLYPPLIDHPLRYQL